MSPTEIPKPTGRASVTGALSAETPFLLQTEFEQNFTDLFRSVKRVKQDTFSGTVNTIKRGDLLLINQEATIYQDDLIPVKDQIFPAVLTSRAEKILFDFETRHGAQKDFIKSGRIGKDYILQIATYSPSEQDPLVLTLAFNQKEPRDGFRNLLKDHRKLVTNKIVDEINTGLSIEKKYEEFGKFYTMSGFLLGSFALTGDQTAQEALALKEYSLGAESSTLMQIHNALLDDRDRLRYILALLEDTNGTILPGREQEHQRLTQRLTLIREQQASQQQLSVTHQELPPPLRYSSDRSPSTRLPTPAALRVQRVAKELLGELSDEQKEALAFRAGPQELFGPIAGTKPDKQAAQKRFIQLAQVRGSKLSRQRLTEIFESNKWEPLFEE